MLALHPGLDAMNWASVLLRDVWPHTPTNRKSNSPNGQIGVLRRGPAPGSAAAAEVRTSLPQTPSSHPAIQVVGEGVTHVSRQTP